MAVGLALACGDPNAIAPGSNVEDTLQLGALTGTPLSMPSAYSVEAGAVRTDRTTRFEFAFNILPDGRPVFLPLAVLGLSSRRSAEPGLQATSMEFDAITEAPSNGYVTRDTVTVAVGERYFVRSRVEVCTVGVPLYAKVQILAIDLPGRTLTFRALANITCGLRGLEPGTPEK